MPPDPHRAPDDPQAWLRLAHEDLALATSNIPGVGFGLLSFHAQQAAEKAVETVLLARKISFPYVHDLGRLLEVAGNGGLTIPPEVAQADLLTDYATLAWYPGAEEIEAADHQRAVATAREVIAWAAAILAAEQ